MITKEIEYYLSLKTTDLRKEIAADCTIEGEDCWLFVPKQPVNKVCVVAHIDTVHPENWKMKELVHQKDSDTLWSPQGLGADDRAGVWAGLHLFNAMDPMSQPYLLLCDKEEQHGIGAYKAAEAFKDIFQSEAITYFIEMDRMNSHDSVFYCEERDDFRKYVNSFGFAEAHGTFSDVAVLGPVARKCTVNLSTGYYYQHTKREILVVSELVETVNKVKQMLMDNAAKQKIWLN